MWWFGKACFFVRVNYNLPLAVMTDTFTVRGTVLYIYIYKYTTMRCPYAPAHCEKTAIFNKCYFAGLR